MKIGVIALQGDVREHLHSLTEAGAVAVEVRRPKDIEPLDGLVMPGGESTTIRKLLATSLLDRAITRFAEQGRPIFGTCAGVILMGRSVNGREPPPLGLMDVKVDRNAYGRQIQSFEADLEIPSLGEQPFAGVFIRAPRIASVGPGIQVLGELGGCPVLVRQGRRLGATFHPEMTDDLRLHRYFLSLAGAELAATAGRGGGGGLDLEG